MEPKNTLIVVSDEHGRQYSGCYGHPIVRTPFIDSLAETGTRFSRAYTPSPTCVSARACLATGQWVHQNECFSSVEAYDGSRPSWGHRLLDAGHQVVSFGKLGYRQAGPGNGFSREFLPIHNLNGVGWLRGLLRNPLDIPEVNFEISEFARHIGVGETDYTKYDRLVCDTACAWLRAHGKTPGKPWTMFVSFTSPHYPLICPREFYDLYADVDIGLPHAKDEAHDHALIQEYLKFYNHASFIDDDLALEARRAYFGLCSFTDYLIGNLLATLGNLDLRDDTRILYTSDHGEMLGAHGIWTKMIMYEDSVSIPMILNGPDVPEGKVVDTAVSLVDCFPTFIECAGLEQGQDDKDLPGESLFRIADGAIPTRTIISEYHDGGVSTGMFMLLNDRWKYVYYPGFKPQLFDLVDDPMEDDDLAKSPNHQNVLNQCDAKLRDLLDPDGVNQQAFEKQARIIAEFGGYEAIRSNDQADIFIEVDALYVNSEELRTPVDEIVK